MPQLVFARPSTSPSFTSPCAGTGKSTTIFHVIDSRVRQDARVLVTSTRNQAVDAVTEKVHTFGVLVSPPSFASETAHEKMALNGGGRGYARRPM